MHSTVDLHLGRHRGGIDNELQPKQQCTIQVRPTSIEVLPTSIEVLPLPVAVYFVAYR